MTTNQQNWSPSDAIPYIAGVDRSPTEVADLFRADHPDGDPVEFLVAALGLDPSAAAEAVVLCAAQSEPVPTAPATGPSIDVIIDHDPAVEAIAAVRDAATAEVELTPEGLAPLSMKQLKAIAVEAGITPGRKSWDDLAAEILAVVAYADAVEQQAAGAANQEG